MERPVAVHSASVSKPNLTSADPAVKNSGCGCGESKMTDATPKTIGFDHLPRHAHPAFGGTVDSGANKTV